VGLPQSWGSCGYLTNNWLREMIETLNSFRDTLEDLGAGLGVTDAVSGPVVLDLIRGS
jgi:hypothetical protein